MPIKKLSFENERNIVLKNIKKRLLETKFLYTNVVGGDGFGYKEILKKLFDDGEIKSDNLMELTTLYFGKPSNKNELEWKLNEIIMLNNLLFFYFKLEIGEINNEFNYKNKKRRDTLLGNLKQELSKYFPDYEIIYEHNSLQIIEYQPKKYKTIIDNLKDIEIEKTKPIVELLKDNKSDAELIGWICKSYKEFEKVKKENLNNLKNIDKSIYDRIWNLAKMLVNNVDGAKGHKGESELTIKDIAHNFALNASLIQKLINLNEQKGEKNA